VLRREGVCQIGPNTGRNNWRKKQNHRKERPPPYCGAKPNRAVRTVKKKRTIRKVEARTDSWQKKGEKSGRVKKYCTAGRWREKDE